MGVAYNHYIYVYSLREMHKHNLILTILHLPDKPGYTCQCQVSVLGVSGYILYM